MASVAPRYARAFAEVAESARLDSAKALGQMRDFDETLAGSGELREYLMNPSVEMAQKLKVLDAISGKIGMFPQVRNFVAVILEHHRLDDLNEILTEYAEVVDEHAGATEAVIPVRMFWMQVHARSSKRRLQSWRAQRSVQVMWRMPRCWVAP